MHLLRFFILGFCIFSAIGAGNNDTHTLTIEIEGVDNDKGTILVILFQGEEGFPSQKDKALSYNSGKVSGGKATVVFKNLPKGSYAITTLHDENGNGEMDTNFLGVPKEAYGASNDANCTFGPPKYKDATFEITGDKSITIQMRRFF